MRGRGRRGRRGRRGFGSRIGHGGLSLTLKAQAGGGGEGKLSWFHPRYM